MSAKVPVYIWAPEEEGQFQPGRCSRWWLHQSLKAFEKDLRALGTSMVYRRSPESRAALVQLVQETGAQARPASPSERRNSAQPVSAFLPRP
jgi:cryptochrome 1